MKMEDFTEELDLACKGMHILVETYHEFIII